MTGMQTPRAEVYADLLKMKPGWLDGEGEAIAQANIDKLEVIIQHFAAVGVVGQPYVYPSEGAGARAEYEDEGFTVEVTNNGVDLFFLRGGPGLHFRLVEVIR